ncbi:hypothetical protein V8F20_012561 [Naviculisporaceae sp. PSN 640]
MSSSSTPSALRPEEHERASEMMMALRIAVNNYTATAIGEYVQAGSKQNDSGSAGVDKNKAEMYEAHESLVSFLDDILNRHPKDSLPRDPQECLKLVAKDIGWSAAHILRYRAMERIVEDHKKADRERALQSRKQPEKKAKPPKPPVREDKEDEDDGWVLTSIGLLRSTPDGYEGPDRGLVTESFGDSTRVLGSAIAIIQRLKTQKFNNQVPKVSHSISEVSRRVLRLKYKLPTMMPTPEMALMALKALRLATNIYAQARLKGQTGESILTLQTNMLTSRQKLRDLLDTIFRTIPKTDRPADKLALLIKVTKYVNWTYKQVLLYRALEKLIDELMREDSGGERSALWAKLLKKTLPREKPQRSAWKAQPPKLPPIEEANFEPDLDEDWVIVEAEDLSEITDEAYVKVLRVHLLGAYYPDFDIIDKESI